MLKDNSIKMKIKTNELPIVIKKLIIVNDKLVGTVGVKGHQKDNLNFLKEVQVDSQLDMAKQKIQSAISYMN